MSLKMRAVSGLRGLLLALLVAANLRPEASAFSPSITQPFGAQRLRASAFSSSTKSNDLSVTGRAPVLGSSKTSGLFSPESNAFSFQPLRLVGPQSHTSQRLSTARARPLRLEMKSGMIPLGVRVAVMGGGSFGLAMSSILGQQGIPVTILVRGEQAAESINKNHTSPSYLKGVELPHTVRATTDPAEALSDATFIVHAVPVQFSRKFLQSVRQYIGDEIPVICTSKGIETGSLSMMSDILQEELGDKRDYAYLSGPSFAREIATGMVTAVVVASYSDNLANLVVDLFSCDTFRVFTSRDVVGVEVGGATKNVIAIAAGIVEGLGLGTNAIAGLVTRGCLEMQTLAKALGSNPATLMGLSGVGDTFGTCFGPLSRNRQLGMRLGQGEHIDDILATSTEVAEGYATSLVLVEFLKKKLPKSFRMDLKYPILFGVAEILSGDRTPSDGMKDLMNLPLRMETYDVYDLNDLDSSTSNR